MSTLIPELNEGEIYVGAIIAPDGTGHHVILLDGDRVEQALLFKHLADRFKQSWYWSNTQHSGTSDSAWYQYFNYGNQGYSSKYYELRARAVRRSVI
jgi:hypothetical protein